MSEIVSGYIKMDASEVIQDAIDTLTEIYRQRDLKKESVITRVLAKKKLFSGKPKFATRENALEWIKRNNNLSGADLAWEYRMADMFCYQTEEDMIALATSAERVLNTPDPFVFVSVDNGRILNKAFSMRGNAKTSSTVDPTL